MKDGAVRGAGLKENQRRQSDAETQNGLAREQGDVAVQKPEKQPYQNIISQRTFIWKYFFASFGFSEKALRPKISRAPAQMINTVQARELA
ncbi:MAG: hypothetical protein K6U74_01325 [Firmicutes bacterium]|nr:hypothetical protein [Bacillota bacterium]